LIDFDLVSLSSLNRHAVATLADVGTPKVTATKNFFAKIAPWADVEAKIELWNDSPHGHQLLNGADWVIGQFALPPVGPLFPLSLINQPCFSSSFSTYRCD
jgi:tRNA A37 threonylcarbamoyladenosine dehydratase